MAFTYTDRKTQQISFPLGGIGSGCIGLGGDGRLRDWEIFNRPNKGSMNGFSHFAIKAEADGRTVDARALHADLAPPYSGEYTGKNFTGFGFGPRGSNLAGVPHFESSEFDGEFPFGTVRFIDETFPGTVSLRGFNPFIPLDDKNSSIPAAFFEVAVENPTAAPLAYTVAFTVSNPTVGEDSRNELVETDATNIVCLTTRSSATKNPAHGGLAIGTDAGEGVAHQQYWYRGHWFDGLGVYWRDFTAPGALADRTYGSSNTTGAPDSATLTRRIQVGPGETARFRFVLAWFYPNCVNYWSQRACDCESGDCESGECDRGQCCANETWLNYYATQWTDQVDVATYALSQWDELERRTRAFARALFGTTVPPEVLDAASANISILKSPTCLRLTDGSFYGFEGCHQNSGCCEGSCAHVWNYAYALPYLFPKLERSMRDLELTHNLGEDGGLSFRLQLPVGSPRWGFRACVDGQYGAVIKAYRDWKIGGDDEWLARIWPSLKKVIEFAWAQANPDRWDPDKTGVMTGRQHHTLDMELFGENAWLTGLYLAGLKAGAEIAEHVGDAEAAREYRAVFARGKARLDTELYNGEYYHQIVDLADRTILESFRTDNDAVIKGGDIIDAYWDDEHREIKYQIGDGCGIDQVLAQWHANLVGLGEVFEHEKVVSALKSIHRYNFKPSFRTVFNPCRTFCLNDEAGTVICDWPEGTRKPYVPVVYAEETMHGFEYQVACHMVQEGLVDEGLELVRAVRDRYDGERRNPWNEIECGSNYARSMASYALIIAFSGFSCDALKRRLGFNPIFRDGPAFGSIWSMGSAWGELNVTEARVAVRVTEGALAVSRLDLPFLTAKPTNVTVDGTVSATRRPVEFSWNDGTIEFATAIEIGAGEELRIERT